MTSISKAFAGILVVAIFFAVYFVATCESLTSDPVKQYELAEKYYRGNIAERNLENAIKWYRCSAEQGYANAQYQLAVIYATGDGVQKDIAKAEAWSNKAKKQLFDKAGKLHTFCACSLSAEKGDANEQFKLANLYRKGEGVEMSNAEAAKWYLKAAKNGNADAQYELAQCYHNGIGAEKNETEAAKWRLKAAENGNANAQYELALCCHNGIGIEKNVKEAVRWFIEADKNGHRVDNEIKKFCEIFQKAENGDAKAQFELAGYYLSGKIVEQNQDEAIKYYCLSANNGFVESQYELANRYLNGEDVSKDVEKAIEMYRKAANAGHSKAQYQLAVIYAAGNEAEKNLAEAEAWSRKAKEQGFEKADELHAFCVCSLSAENGDAEEQFNLANRYRNGEGVSPNMDEAVKWYHKSAENGNSKAQCELARLYYTGESVSKNLDEAIKWHLKAAQQGLAQSQYELARIYTAGEGVSPNMDEAVKWYRKAAENGNSKAQYELARLYYAGESVSKNMDEAIKWHIKAAQQGMAESQYELARIYANGIDIERNITEAEKWSSKAKEQGFEKAEELHDFCICYKAAEQGYADAQFELGNSYMYGWVVEKNLKEAKKWYLKAKKQGRLQADSLYNYCVNYLDAENNNPEAQHALAGILANGIGVGKNMKEAVKWYIKAAENGNINSQFELGKRYHEGKGVEKNMDEAMKWHRMSAESGNTAAMVELAKCYHTGDGVDKNMVEAIKWYRKAAESGLADIQYRLAGIYANGDGVEKNMDEAISWYQLAGENGLVEAQYELARIYVNGAGVERNIPEAEKWSSKAKEQKHDEAGKIHEFCIVFQNAQKGDDQAQLQLAEFYLVGNGVEKNLDEVEFWSCKSKEQGNNKAEKLHNYCICYKAAMQGYAKAQYQLAKIYHAGDGVQKDMKEALAWYRKAAENKQFEAQYQIAEIYENGDGVDRDINEALVWYHKAAENGESLSQLKLANWYAKGIHVEKNLTEAVKWYLNADKNGMRINSKLKALCVYYDAAEKGDVEKQCRLGEFFCYEAPIFTDGKYLISFSTAIEEDLSSDLEYRERNRPRPTLFRNDRSSDLEERNFELKYLGFGQDVNEGIKWFRKAAENDCVFAQCSLASIYANGDGVKENIEEAMAWSYKAMRQGSKRAEEIIRFCECYKSAYIYLNNQYLNNYQFDLAECYYYGRGVRKDIEKAKKWYRIASENGNSRAREKLHALEEPPRLIMW